MRFTTRRLFLISAGISLALATLRGAGSISRLDWPAFSLSLISFFAVLGLCQQIGDLFQCRWERTLSRDEAFAVWLAVLWRAAVATALLACYALQLLISRGFVDSEFRGTEEVFRDYGALFPDLAWSLLVFVTLAAIPRAVPSRHGHFYVPGLRRAAAWILAFALILVLLCGTTLVYMLVHIATAGIEVHQPLRFQRQGTFPDHASEGYRFFWLSCLAAVFIAVNMLALGGLARTAHRQSRLNHPALAVLLAGLALTTGYVIWYALRELPRISPDLASANLPLNPAGVLFLVGAILGLPFVLAIRLSKQPHASVPDGFAWRRPCGYVHESRIVALMALGLAAYHLAFLQDDRPTGWLTFQNLYDAINAVLWFGSIGGLIEMAGWALHWPPTYLWLAVAWVALRLLFCRSKAESVVDSWPLQSISARRFLAFYLLAMWFIASGLFTLAAFAFAWWFGPWFG